MAGLISIIIPLYNGEKYIETCLKSIFNQSYENYEIILAYDTKSSDNTFSIISKLAEEHPIIIDVGCDTSTGVARNRGFKRASGEYIIFMDADDELMPDYLERFISTYTKYPSLEAVHCNYVHTSEEKLASARDIAAKSSDEMLVYSQEDALYALLLKFSGGSEPFSGSPWTWMVKKDFLIKNNIEFPNYSFGDETVYAWKIIGSAKELGVSLKKTYLWIQHNTSLTTNYFSNSSWDKRKQMREDIGLFFKETNPEFYTDVVTMQQRDLAFIFSMAFDTYKEFKAELNKYGIRKLGLLEKNEPLLGYCCVWCFNISKPLFYICSRMASSSKKLDHLFGRL